MIWPDHHGGPHLPLLGYPCTCENLHGKHTLEVRTYCCVSSHSDMGGGLDVTGADVGAPAPAWTSWIGLSRSAQNGQSRTRSINQAVYPSGKQSVCVLIHAPTFLCMLFIAHTTFDVYGIHCVHNNRCQYWCPHCVWWAPCIYCTYVYHAFHMWCAPCIPCTSHMICLVYMARIAHNVGADTGTYCSQRTAKRLALY